jgi:hypothetical protein
MENTLEKIITDLYTLEPALADKDREVRLIVETLLNARPGIVPDAAFRAALRAKLLEEAAVPQPKTLIPGLPLWMVYLTPVGVAAVLLVMLLPYQPVHAPMPVPIPLPEVSTEAADVIPEGATLMKRSAPAEDTALFESAQPMQMSADSLPVNMIDVPPQLAANDFTVSALTVTAPTFVVVLAAGLDGQPSTKILSVSALIEPGSYEQFVIPLEFALEPGINYFVTLYQDNGDGTFSRTDDFPVFTAEQTEPILVPFSVQSDDDLYPVM